MRTQKKSELEAREKCAYIAGYKRGVEDLASIMCNVVSVQQLVEIVERFERLQKPVNMQSVVQ